MKKKIVKPKQYRVVFEVGTMYGVCFVYAETEAEARGKFLAEYGSSTATITTINEEN